MDLILLENDPIRVILNSVPLPARESKLPRKIESSNRFESFSLDENVKAKNRRINRDPRPRERFLFA